MVESYNGSLRGTSAIFIRRTKCYAKCLNSVYLGVKMWIYKKFIRDNLENIIGCCYGWLWGSANSNIIKYNHYKQIIYFILNR